MIDDRPIKPDRQYLDAYIQKMSSQVDQKTFLKRKGKDVLPCHQKNVGKCQEIEKKEQRKGKKSKAQIYQEIKIKNKAKFGQKKIEEPKQEQNKKLDPKKMTVNYRPKSSKKPKIDTQEYKKNQNKSKLPKNQKEQQKQIEYDKLLQYFNKQMQQFQEQKSQFQKVATKLKFKQSISHQQGLLFSKMRNQVKQNLLTQKSGIKSCKNQIENQQVHNNRAEKDKVKRQCNIKTKDEKNSKLFSKTYSISQIKKKMQKATQQYKKQKQKLLGHDLQINEYRYDISQIYILPEFTPITIYQYLDHQKIMYNCNDFYLLALKAFHQKFQKDERSVKVDDVCQKDEELNSLQKKDIKVKYIGEKRVMKYGQWTQVWHPGKQRLMANKQGYKVIWLNNGDVVQQYPNNIKTYYSKTKQILKIQYKQQPSIYYHYNSKQIWRIINNKRQIVYSNGQSQVVENKVNSYY